MTSPGRRRCRRAHRREPWPDIKRQTDQCKSGLAELGEIRPPGLALLDEDEDHTPRVAEPRGAQSGDIRDLVDQEINSLVLQCLPGLFQVVADQSDMRQPWVGEAGGPPRIAAVGA